VEPSVALNGLIINLIIDDVWTAVSEDSKGCTDQIGVIVDIDREEFLRIFA
jgi:hypothetical protein